MSIRDRINVYKQLIKDINRGKRFFFCHVLVFSSREGGIEKDYPELWIYRPRNLGIAWCNDEVKDGMQQRKQCLINAIELCDTYLLFCSLSGLDPDANL